MILRFSRSASLLFLLTLFLFGSGCGSSSGDFVATGGPGSGPVTPLERTLFGRLFLTELAPRATVEVVATESDAVFLSLVTDGSGNFRIPEGTSLPTQFRVRASAPEGVVVERFVDRAEEREYLWLNVPSSLISAYKLANPGTPLAEIEGRLKATLMMEAEDGLYGTADNSASPFSHRLFLEEAQAAGGVQEYIRSLVSLVEDGGRISFAGGSGFVGSRNNFPNFTILARGFISEVGGFLLEETAGAIYDKTVEETVGELGKTTALSGLRFGKAAKYEAVFEALEAIEDELSEITKEINEDYLDTLSTDDRNDLDDYLLAVSTAFEQLQDLTASFESAITNAGEEDEFDHGTGAIPDSRTSTLAFYSSVVGDNATNALEKFLTSSNPSVNILILAARSVQAEYIPSASSVDAEHQYYPIRRDDFTEDALETFQLYAGYAQQVGILSSESANTYYLPQAVIQSGTGEGYQPPSPQLNAAYHDQSELYGILGKADLEYVTDPTGSTQVFMDTVNRKMWYLSTGLGSYSEAQNGLIDLEVNNWRYPDNYSKPSYVGNDLDDVKGFQRSDELKGWRVPTSTELKQLRSLLAKIDSSAPGDAQKTFSALVALGFTGLINPSDDNDDNYKKFWCNDKPPLDLIGQVQFTYYDMKDDTFTGEAVDDRVIEGDSPDWTIVYVRDIQRFDQSPNFGDTMDQLVRSYGTFTDSLSIEEVSTSIGDTGSLATIFTLKVKAHKANDYVPPGNVSDLVEIKVNDENGSTANPPAFARYRLEPGNEINVAGEQVDVGTTVIDLIFRRPGSATIVATLGDLTVTKSYSAGEVPEIQSIMVSPQNLKLQGIPSEDSSYQYYCTGFLATGETVDLTRLATWTLETPSGGTVPTVLLNSSNGGLLEFGSRDSLSQFMTVKASYGRDGDSTSFGAYGKQMSDESTLEIPLQ